MMCVHVCSHVCVHVCGGQRTRLWSHPSPPQAQPPNYGLMESHTQIAQCCSVGCFHSKLLGSEESAFANVIPHC